MEKLIKILKELHPDVDYNKCDTLIDDKIFDSFDIVTIVADVHEQFGVIIPAGEIVAENFNSAASIWQLIQELG